MTWGIRSPMKNPEVGLRNSVSPLKTAKLGGVVLPKSERQHKRSHYMLSRGVVVITSGVHLTCQIWSTCRRKGYTRAEDYLHSSYSQLTNETSNISAPRQRPSSKAGGHAHTTGLIQAKWVASASLWLCSLKPDDCTRDGCRIVRVAT
jgi:hypothetical protein